MKAAYTPIRADERVFVIKPDGSRYEDNRFRDVEQYWRAFPDAIELRIWREVLDCWCEVRRLVHPRERARRTYNKPTPARRGSFVHKR